MLLTLEPKTETEVSIAEIHGIKVYGRLPERHIESLKKIERITERLEWLGVKRVYATDAIFGTGIVGSYVTYLSKDMNVTFSMSYDDYTLAHFEVEPKDCPFIVISSFHDEYAFAINVVHELGHHVNNDNSKERKRLSEETREVRAHLFAMERVKVWDFEKKHDITFYYWGEATKRYIELYNERPDVTKFEMNSVKSVKLNDKIIYTKFEINPDNIVCKKYPKHKEKKKAWGKSFPINNPKYVSKWEAKQRKVSANMI